MLFARLKTWRAKRQWEKMGRNERTIWMHRYFRLHKELLNDPVYKTVYDRNRLRVIERIQQRSQEHRDSEELGDFIDWMADAYNDFAAKKVNRYQPIMEENYVIWKLMMGKMEEK